VAHLAAPSGGRKPVAKDNHRAYSGAMLRMPIRVALVPVLVLTGALPACTAAREGYPSLAPRPIEGAFEARARPGAENGSVADPAVEARAAEQATALDAAEARFRSAEGETRAAVSWASNQPAGSDAWVVAQQSLSALDASRSATTAVLTAIDVLRLELAQRETPVASASLDALAARADALDADQRRALAELNGALPLP